MMCDTSLAHPATGRATAAHSAATDAQSPRTLR
ncbi:hypothetical protein SRB17_36600 [Streptomyces sp. RB17]|nr:hypothetical protein [Streptomyces sp. RB17]